LKISLEFGLQNQNKRYFAQRRKARQVGRNIFSLRSLRFGAINFLEVVLVNILKQESPIRLTVALTDELPTGKEDRSDRAAEQSSLRRRVSEDRGKITRRLLRDIADGRTLGDTTTLADPAVVAKLKEQYEEE
jgi:hypothetical protein